MLRKRSVEIVNGITIRWEPLTYIGGMMLRYLAVTTGHEVKR